MNIGFDASRAFIKNRTGTENYSYQILKNLVQIDHTNNYYIYIRPGVEVTPPPKEWPKNFHFKLINYPRLWTQIGLATQTFIDKLDVLFIPAHTLPLIRKSGLKTVVTVHDLGAEYLPQTHQLKQRLYLKMMTDFQLKSATHLIAVSKATKSDIIKKVGVPEENISVVYEGYDKENFKVQISKSEVSQSIKKYNLAYQEYFLFIGTIQPRKNLERLIRAYNQLLIDKTRGDAKEGSRRRARSASEDGRWDSGATGPRAIYPKLVLAGGKGWLSDEIYKLPKELGIEDQIKFLGYVPDKDTPALYSGAKAFLFPSLFEGFGIPILEAFTCGCPVLTSNTSSMPEVAGDGAILVDPYSEDEITKGIKLIMNEELRIKNIKNGFKQAERFSWKLAAKETLNVLENV